ncbi:MAG: beta/gamma crystallin-related protein [Casimicrobiaceae bacterium]
MTKTLKSLLAASACIIATHASAQVTFYEREGFRGRAFPVNQTVWNFERSGFNDRAASAIVERGRWEVCEDERFGGRCAILQRGNYDSLALMGLGRSISSVRPVNGPPPSAYNAPPPPPAPVYEYRQRPSERLFQANVTSVRAVVGPPEQRCWVEKQQVVENNSSANVPGAIIGAVLGGVLGHQVGGGRGKDVATAGGAVAGAAVGANVGRGGGQVYNQDVQRCSTVQGSARPDYWDVTYEFRGYQHRAGL